MPLCRIVTLLVILLASTHASAQSLEAYATGGAGGWVHDWTSYRSDRGVLLSGAGGIEWRPAPHVGIGGEAGLLASPEGELAATLGVDARLHLLGARPSGTWAPYVFAGYSPLRLIELSDHGVQFGAGIDYRLGPRRALRFELRDIVRDSTGRRSHYWTGRVGVTFGLGRP